MFSFVVTGTRGGRWGGSRGRMGATRGWDKGQDLLLPPGTSALGMGHRHNAPPHHRMAIGSRSHMWHEFGSSQPGVPPAKDHHAEGTPLLSSAAASLRVHLGTHPAPHRTACYSPQVCCQLMELVPGELPRSLGERRVNEAPATAAGTSTRGTGTGTGRGWMDGRLGGAGCRVSSSIRFG